MINYGDKIFAEENLPNKTLIDLDFIIKETDKLSKSILDLNFRSKYDNITLKQWIESTIKDDIARDIYKSYVIMKYI